METRIPTETFKHTPQETLKAYVKRVQKNIRNLNDKLEFEEHELQRAQAELNRRQLEAFRIQYPGLKIEKGTWLVITEEYVRWYEDQTNQHSGVRVGEQYKIIRLWAFDDAIAVDNLIVSLNAMPPDILLRMQQAWDEKQEETQ